MMNRYLEKVCSSANVQRRLASARKEIALANSKKDSFTYAFLAR